MLRSNPGLLRLWQCQSDAMQSWATNQSDALPSSSRIPVPPFEILLPMNFLSKFWYEMIIVGFSYFWLFEKLFRNHWMSWVQCKPSKFCIRTKCVSKNQVFERSCGNLLFLWEVNSKEQGTGDQHEEDRNRKEADREEKVRKIRLLNSSKNVQKLEF